MYFFKLVKWDIKYVDDVARSADNPHIARWLRDVFPSPYTRTDAFSYVMSCAQNREETQICRAIVIGGRAVGSIGVFQKDDVYRKSGEIGYWLDEEFWNKGIMSMAIAQLCREAFQKLPIVRIYAEPFAENVGSCRALEKAGFTQEGVLRNSICKNGEIQDSCVYGILK